MVRRILTVISALLAGVLVTWFVANAGVGMKAPDITNETWLNSALLHLSDLKGKVVMVEIWTFGYYNCRNFEPYVKHWHQKYADKGFLIIGVHSPEFSYEHDFASNRLISTGHAEALNQALSKAAVPHETYVLPGNDHGFDLNWGGWGTQVARAKISQFLRNHDSLR